ncbi:MAG: FHA domain-containing protein [Gammaproteobacteria bacterium]|nr:FHA domain-containing protein [Gammaproteobacteria bacterium]
MPAKLILTLNGTTISEFTLDKEQLIIGRRPENDIHVDNLAVSGKHAQVITILNDSFLEDLNSTNGTYVNGSLIKKHALKHGDVIGVGKHQLKYINQDAANEDADFEKTMIIRPDAVGMPEHTGSHEVHASIGAIVKAEAKQSTGKPSAGPTAKLQVINGANAGKELDLTKALTTIGKPGTQVAAITRRPQGYFIIHVDGGANNQTPIINGKPIGTQATQLKNHDIIEVANVKMEFFLP